MAKPTDVSGTNKPVPKPAAGLYSSNGSAYGNAQLNLVKAQLGGARKAAEKNIPVETKLIENNKAGYSSNDIPLHDTKNIVSNDMKPERKAEEKRIITKLTVNVEAERAKAKAAELAAKNKGTQAGHTVTDSSNHTRPVK